MDVVGSIAKLLVTLVIYYYGIFLSSNVQLWYSS